MWQTNIGHYVTRSQTTAGHKEVDTEVRNPERVNAAIQHYETSQTIIVTVVKRNGQLVKLEFYQSVVRSFVYHSSRR